MQQQQQGTDSLTESSLEFFNELVAAFGGDSDDNDELSLLLVLGDDDAPKAAVETTVVASPVQQDTTTTTAIDLLLEAGAVIEQRKPAAAREAYVHESTSKKRTRAEEDEERAFINIMPVTKRRWKKDGVWRVHIDRVTKRKNKNKGKVGQLRRTIWHNHGYQSAEEAARAADQFMVACYGAAVHFWQLNFPDDLETIYMVPGGVPDYVFQVLEEQYELKSGLLAYWAYWERVKSRGYIQ